MKLVNKEDINIYNKKVQVEASVGELVILFSLIGNTNLETITAHLNRDGVDKVFVDKVKNELLHFDIYEDFKKVIAELKGDVAND